MMMASLFEPLYTNAETAPQTVPGWLASVSQQRGFAPGAPVGNVPPSAGQEQSQHGGSYAEGERAGRAAALAEIEQQASAHGRLKSALADFDSAFTERLSERLSQTVLALCEATLVPLTTDPDALQRRCIAAAGAVGEGIIDASLRMHPDDIALLDPAFAATWHLVQDTELERGTIVFDMPEGAVRDGPEEWRSALREALGLKAAGL